MRPELINSGLTPRILDDDDDDDDINKLVEADTTSAKQKNMSREIELLGKVLWLSI
jgi:hypothetical protein